MNGWIEINPSVLQGKPVIRNTRIPVELLLRKLFDGATVKELLDAYPRIRKMTFRLPSHTPLCNYSRRHL